MCQKAKAIQENWQPTDWDYMYIFEFDMVDVIVGTETDEGLYSYEASHVVAKKDEFVWLPRQDQLQDILTPGEQLNIWWLIMAIDGKMKSAGYESISWEMIWLAYVMEAKYKCDWQGDKWVST
jgi:hypothetical protein